MSGEQSGAGVSPEIFQGILLERIAEKKEKTGLTRNHDMKRIQEMKSTEGVNPDELFPEEVWESIFNWLRPEDRGNVWKLHDVFRDIMKNTHIGHTLLPQILKFHVEEFWKEKETRWKAPDEEDEEEEECKKVPLANFLELRRVSKIIRNEVDRLLEEDLLNAMERQYIPNHPPKTTSFWFCGPSVHSPANRYGIDKLDRLINIIQENPKTRFISRSITFELMTYMDVEDDCQTLFKEFVRRLTEFLQLAGNQFWHFKLIVWENARVEDNGSDDLNKLLIPLNEWSLLMQNLKWLQFRYYGQPGIKRCRFALQPLSKLKNLERLDLTIPFKSPKGIESIHKVILENNLHIKRIGMSGQVFDAISSATSLETIFTSIFANCNFLKIGSMMNSNWPLKRVFMYVDQSDISISHLFQLLQKFPTLENVSLDLKHPKIGGDMDFLRLPQLTEFELEMDFPEIDLASPIHFFFSLQFLLYAKNLRKLSWKFYISEPDELEDLTETIKRKLVNGSMIQFGSGFGDLWKSNIWQAFPYLEYVYVYIAAGDDEPFEQECSRASQK